MHDLKKEEHCVIETRPKTHFSRARKFSRFLLLRIGLRLKHFWENQHL